MELKCKSLPDSPAAATLLHELHSGSLGGDGSTMAPAWDLALAASFGSAAAWREQFAACAQAGEGGRGWVLLTFQPREGVMVNQWSPDHTQVVAGGVPLLALDMSGDAYRTTEGGAAGCVEAFMCSVDHEKVYARYQDAVHVASEGLACTRLELGRARLFDVRRAGAFEQATHVIEGAQWRDPARVKEWAAELAGGNDVVVYCVYGHEVGRATALRLRSAGVRACFLEGGIDAWQKAGAPLQAK